MEKKDWIRILDRYLIEGTMNPEDYENMEYERKYTIQEYKKAIKRINSKQ
jgi:hypothetical protein